MREMRIAIAGAGFTGLSAAYYLLKQNHYVEIFEKETKIGGLASTFKFAGWEWELEKHYHHWFTNDKAAIDLITELGLSQYLIFPKTNTSIFYNKSIYSFNNPQDVLKFKPLNLRQRLRTGLSTLILKILPAKFAVYLEKFTAFEILSGMYGKKVFNILWKPLLIGKFGRFATQVNMAWFWARIKKRTPRLGYLEGGYHKLLFTIAQRIKEKGGVINLNSPFNMDIGKKYDAVIITTPSFIFTNLYPYLRENYKKTLLSIPHLHALNLLVISSEKILDDVYWLNINNRTFPFIAVIQHTNMVNPKHYGGKHITWIGNYLPPNHPYLKMSKEELFQVYLPFLKKINPRFPFQLPTSNFQLQAFFGPFAQPVFPLNYSKKKPDFITPISNVFLANMDMVYPWDRGTNYAIELGEEVANFIHKKYSK